MKLLLFFILIPFLTVAQTVHVEDGSIVYTGKKNVPGLSATEILIKSKSIFPAIVENYKIDSSGANAENTIKIKGEIKLPTPYTHIRVFNYTLKLITKKEGYEYLINDVTITENRRGSKPKTKTSEEQLDEIESGGKIAVDAEKILNQIDLKLQELLAILHNRLQSS